MISVIGQLIKFMRVYRKFWMTPIIFGLLGIGILLVTTQGSVIGPFLYALF